MLRLRSSVHHSRAEDFGSLLRELDGVRRVVQQADEALFYRARLILGDSLPRPQR